MRAIKQFFVIGIFGLLIAGAVSVSGFYNPARKKLIGKWNVTFEMTQTDLREMGVTNNPIVGAAAQGLMNAAQAEMEIEFRDDDSVTMGMTTFGFFAGEKGTWTASKGDGDQIVVSIHFDGEQEPKQWTIEFADDNRFQLVSSDDTRFPASQLVVFQRVQVDS